MLLNNKIVMIATKNEGKVKEFSRMFDRLHMEVKSLRDFSGQPDVVEDGKTFAENALKKAKEIALRLNLPVLADDSGLRVERLNGAPGVYSARYAGEHATDDMNLNKLLAELRKLPNVSGDPYLSPAQFVCAIALYEPREGSSVQVEGTCDGLIVAEPSGSNGFGYDPVFYLPDFSKTLAELSMEEKNQISHRGQALRSLFERLRAQ